MFFEYDSKKSEANFKKHGIDFKMAQKIWEGVYVEFAAKSEFENRFAIIGPIKEKLYTCIFTLRGERIRIISCRRSREKEALLYEENV
ncbi:MAG: BrnT family toxin [Deltaproteobacteria bacterium]|nr:BrnT family toxin [Deltaproteobacteria bacterium]